MLSTTARGFTMRTRLGAAILVTLLWGTTASAQVSLPKPLFGKSASRFVRPAIHGAQPQWPDVQKLERLRSLSYHGGLSITPGDAGGRTIYAERSSLAVLQPKAAPQQQRGTVAVALGTALIGKSGYPLATARAGAPVARRTGYDTYRAATDNRRHPRLGKRDACSLRPHWRCSAYAWNRLPTRSYPATRGCNRRRQRTGNRCTVPCNTHRTTRNAARMERRARNLPRTNPTVAAPLVLACDGIS